MDGSLDWLLCFIERSICRKKEIVSIVAIASANSCINDNMDCYNLLLPVVLSFPEGFNCVICGFFFCFCCIFCWSPGKLFRHIAALFLQNLVYSYTQSSTALDRMNGHSEYGALYADILNALPKYFHLLLGYLLVFNQKSVNRNNSGQLLTIYLLIAAVTNFLSGIPSVGRFQYMTIPFLAILWAKNYYVLTKYNRLFYLVPLLYAYNILYWCRYMSGVTELGLYLYPAPVTIIRFLFLV